MNYELKNTEQTFPAVIHNLFVMQKINCHLKVTFRNILSNKVYALFCILGSTLTFILVTFFVQMGFIAVSNYPPNIHADRTISISLTDFTDTKGKNVGELRREETDLLLANIKNHESFALRCTSAGNVSVAGKNCLAGTAFINAGFWKVYGFRFLAGGPVSEDDYRNRKHYAVITENLSKRLFHTVNSIGRKIEYYGTELEIKGVTGDFSLLSSPTEYSEIWLPEFLGEKMAMMDILFSKQADMNQAKETVSNAIRQLFARKNVEVQISPDRIYTTREKRLRQFGGEDGFGVAAGVLLFILLSIPAVNIVTLAMTGTHNRLEEIAIKRAFGARRFSVFRQIMAENLVLAVIGTFLAVISVKPVYYFIQQAFLKNPWMEGIPLIPGIDSVVVVLFILPLMLLFLLMFGGIPAYLATRQNIASILKGGAE